MRTAAEFALSLALAAGLVWLLLEWSGTAPGHIVATLGALDPGVFLAALAVHATLYPLRARRLAGLLPAPPPPLGRLTAVSAVHVLAANLLPAKLGEGVLVVALRREGVPGSAGAAALILVRLLDFAAVTGAMALACVGLATFGALDLPWLLPLGGLLAIPALSCGWAAYRSERVARVATRFLEAVGLARTRLGARLVAVAGKVGEALAVVPLRRRATAALWTLPVWVLVFVFYALLARGFGLDELSYLQAVFGSGLAIVATLLPLHGFAGFGVQDAGWVAGFTALGVEAELATASGLAAHVVHVGNLVLFGLVAWICVYRRRPVPPVSPSSG